MEKNSDPLWNGTKTVRDNLETLRIYLIDCVDVGMRDTGDEFYNEILSLIDDCAVLSTMDELSELIERAKIVEEDIDAWLALHGRSSLSLPWPKI